MGGGGARFPSKFRNPPPQKKILSKGGRPPHFQNPSMSSALPVSDNREYLEFIGFCNIIDFLDPRIEEVVNAGYF